MLAQQRLPCRDPGFGQQVVAVAGEGGGRFRLACLGPDGLLQVVGGVEEQGGRLGREALTFELDHEALLPGGKVLGLGFCPGGRAEMEQYQAGQQRTDHGASGRSGIRAAIRKSRRAGRRSR